MDDEKLLQFIIVWVFLLAGLIIMAYELYEKSKRLPPEQYLPNHLSSFSEESKKVTEENKNEQEETKGDNIENVQAKDKTKSTEAISTTLLSRIPFSMLPFGYRDMGRLQQDKNILSSTETITTKGKTPEFRAQNIGNQLPVIASELSTFGKSINEAKDEVSKQEKEKKEQEEKRKVDSEKLKNDMIKKYEVIKQQEEEAKAAEAAPAKKLGGLGAKAKTTLTSKDNENGKDATKTDATAGTATAGAASGLKKTTFSLTKK